MTTRDVTPNILAVFDTEAVSESGAWLHLVTPGTDEPAYADEQRKKPLRIRIKGPDSDTWTSFQRKAMAQSDKKDKRSGKEIALEDARLFARMTLEVQNVPGYESADREQLVDLYVKYKDIRMQALQFVLHRENFTGTPAND